MSSLVTAIVASSPLQVKFQEAKSLSDKGKLMEANQLLQQVYSQAVTSSDRKFLHQVISLTCDNNFILGDYAGSLRQCLEIEKILKDAKMTHELAVAENNLGAIYKRLGLHANALFKYLESLIYSFQTNDEPIMSSSLLNAATPLFDAGYIDKAFRALDTALMICDKNAGNPRFEQTRLVIYNNRATFCIKLGRFEEALKLLQKSRELIFKYSVFRELPSIDSNISMCLVRLNRVDEGYKLLHTVLKKRKDVYDDHHVADLIKMGSIYKDYFRDDKKFLEYCEKALKLAESKQLVLRELFINNLLKEYYYGKGNIAEVQRIEKRLRVLEEQDNLNKQTRGMETLFDAKLMTIETMLRQEGQKPEFLSRYDYLTGTYSYTQHGVTMHVPLRDIAFCEVRGNYLHIHTFIRNSAGHLVLDESHKLRKTMKEFITETGAEAAFFARIHNSFIVNLYRLTRDSLKNGETLLIGGRELKISDTYRKPFKEQLNSFLEQDLNMQ